MIGGLFWAAQWAKKIKESHDRRMEQMGLRGKRHRRTSDASHRAARRIKLSAAEKEQLKVRLAEQHENHIGKII